MAVRRWAVQPELSGEVSRDAMVQAFMDGEALLARAGGVLTVIVGRHPTDLPGEMVTTSAVFEWKDRTDARPQPERAGDVLPRHQAEPDPQPEPEPAPQPEPVAVGAAVDDGLDPSTLDDEDLSSVPEDLR